MSSALKFRRSPAGVRRSKRGFSLIEALVAITIVSIGLTAVMGGLAALGKSDSRMHEAELMQRLAVQKYDELVATGSYATSDTSGDFTDQNQPDLQWSTTVEPSGVENLDALTLTVTRASGAENAPQATIEGLVYVPPATAAPGGQQP